MFPLSAVLSFSTQPTHPDSCSEKATPSSSSNMYLRRVATILSQVWRQLFRLSSPAIHFAFSQAFCRRTGTAREIGTDLHSYKCRFKRRLSSDPNIHFSHIYISRFLPVIGVCGRSLVILSCKVVFDPHISSFNENIWIPAIPKDH